MIEICGHVGVWSLGLSAVYYSGAVVAYVRALSLSTHVKYGIGL